MSALQASLGQAVDPAKPLMTLTPRGGALRAELYVPSRAIGFVKTGQRVRLLYDAFPYQKFGPGRGGAGGPLALRPPPPRGVRLFFFFFWSIHGRWHPQLKRSSNAGLPIVKWYSIGRDKAVGSSLQLNKSRDRRRGIGLS